MHRFSLIQDHQFYQPYLNELGELLGDMDIAYNRVADVYGFHCTGCADSCCRSRFYHHTLLEYLYLSAGLMELPTDQKDDVLTKANRLKTSNSEDRPMCPANLDGCCRLYRFRPMICRLHGVAHEFVGPDNTSRNGPGCNEFTLLAGDPIDVRLDRTLLYRRMALLEKRLRERIKFKGRIRMTVAEMVIHAANGF